jgi:hypothetical protein
VTFFSYQSKNDYLIESSDIVDFFVNRKYTLEIGGVKNAKIQFLYAVRFPPLKKWHEDWISGKKFLDMELFEEIMRLYFTSQRNFS